jgi:hypothetical protein
MQENKLIDLAISEPTIIDIFIHHHKNEDTIVGDLCKDIMDDKGYPVGTSVESQLEYINALYAMYPALDFAIEEFLRRLKQFQAIKL